MDSPVNASSQAQGKIRLLQVAMEMAAETGMTDGSRASQIQPLASPRGLRLYVLLLLLLVKVLVYTSLPIVGI